MEDYSWVSIRVPIRLEEKMRSTDIDWNKVLRKAIEAKVREHERKKTIEEFLRFRSRNHIPRNKTRYTSEVLIRESREG